MTAATVAAVRRAPIKVRAGVGKVRSSKDAIKIKKVSRNGVYTLVEVRHPDGSRSRFRVPSRSLSERIEKETAAARSKTAV
jgi:rRNA maturation protein Nop10